MAGGFRVADTDTTIVVDAWGEPQWKSEPFDVMVRDEPVVVTGINGPVWTLTRTKPKAHSVGHPVTGPGFADWAECYERNRLAHPEIFPVNAAGDPEALYTGKSSPYVAYSRGALALVVGEEVAGAEAAVEPFEWIDGEFVRSVSSSWEPVARKWAIQPGPASDTLAADLRLILVTTLRALAKLRRRGDLLGVAPAVPALRGKLLGVSGLDPVGLSGEGNAGEYPSGADNCSGTRMAGTDP
jgi:hypothetical protein